MPYSDVFAQLIAARADLFRASNVINEIAAKCLDNAEYLSAVERERQRHQDRANTEAVAADTARRKLTRIRSVIELMPSEKWEEEIRRVLDE